jgi:hypothetical protein
VTIDSHPDIDRHEKGPPRMGRLRIHADDAARSRAYRDRVREERIQSRAALARAERRAEKAEAKVRALKSRKLSNA